MRQNKRWVREGRTCYCWEWPLGTTALGHSGADPGTTPTAALHPGASSSMLTGVWRVCNGPRNMARAQTHCTPRVTHVGSAGTDPVLCLWEKSAASGLAAAARVVKSLLQQEKDAQSSRASQPGRGHSPAAPWAAPCPCTPKPPPKAPCRPPPRGESHCTCSHTNTGCGHEPRQRRRLGTD